MYLGNYVDMIKNTKTMINPKTGYEIEDLSDNVFNHINVIKYYGTNKWGKVLWLCTCKCGKEVTITSATIKNSKKGCNHVIDLKGQKFNKLTVLEY